MEIAMLTRYESFSPPGWLKRRIRREVIRLSADGQAALRATDLRRLMEHDLPAVLAALRALPDGAGAEAVTAALAPLREAMPSDADACWFCGRTRAESRRMIQGGLARICKECVSSAVAALAAPVGGATESARCGFCRRWSGADAWLVDGEIRLFRARHGVICNDCVALALEILSDVQE
jgi:hypothetical protein